MKDAFVTPKATKASFDGLRVWKRTGLPAPAWNVDLFDGAGRFIARPDAWCDEVGLAWEIDSAEYHFGRDGYARTLGRNTRYAAAGIVLVQTLPKRLRTEPDAVAAELVGRVPGRGAAVAAQPRGSSPFRPQRRQRVAQDVQRQPVGGVVVGQPQLLGSGQSR